MKLVFTWGDSFVAGGLDWVVLGSLKMGWAAIFAFQAA
jgi:hypothetical protein